MGSNRQKHRMSSVAPRRRQTGITAIGFLFLAVVFGTLGFGVIKVVPLYMERMRIRTVLEDMQTEFGTGENSLQEIRRTLGERFVVESLDIPHDAVSITRNDKGYLLRVQQESRATFLADLSFVIDIDEKVEISR
jgi:hypothetical protein